MEDPLLRVLKLRPFQLGLTKVRSIIKKSLLLLACTALFWSVSAEAQVVSTTAGEVVFLVDGDRTLSPDDTSRAFLSSAGIDPLVIKRRFAQDGYVFDAFRFHAEMHLAIGETAFAEHALNAATEARLHPGAKAFLSAAVQKGHVFVVSAGIPRIWRVILDRLGLESIGVIGGIEPKAPLLKPRLSLTSGKRGTQAIMPTPNTKKRA